MWIEWSRNNKARESNKKANKRVPHCFSSYYRINRVNRESRIFYSPSLCQYLVVLYNTIRQSTWFVVILSVVKSPESLDNLNWIKFYSNCLFTKFNWSFSLNSTLLSKRYAGKANEIYTCSQVYKFTSQCITSGFDVLEHEPDNTTYF